MTPGDAAAGDDPPPATRTHAFLAAVRDVGVAWSDPIVDVAAVLAIAAVVYFSPSEATMQIVAGSVSSIAIGKRYIGRAK